MLSLIGTQAVAQAPERLEFTRVVAHWAEYADEGYLSFIEDAEPELVQLGFYGAHFWSLAHTPQYGGYPAHFPVQGLDECGQWFQDKNAALHKRNARVVGHFNVEFLVGDPDGPDGPRGFFKFYRDLWDESVLGPRPVENPIELLERDAEGKPIVNQSYSIGGMKEYWACLRNPHWQQVLKAWVKQGVERGMDGFIANYFYRHNCLCEHCHDGFRGYMAERYDAEQLREQFGIEDLATHVFDEIVSWHNPQESTPLRREMLRWSQISNKQVFDEVFVRYGRSLKPDLIVAQWNHLGDFSAISGDERCLLPAESWGTGEDYLWYSTGASANHTDVANNFFGDATLQARYIRGAFDDKPFTLGKYESTRIRAAIAELAANGGAPMGFYTRFTDPAAREVIVQYYQFLKRYDALFHANQSHAEVLLMFPRSAVHQGNVAALETFRNVGKQLLDEHVLFDIKPDDLCDEATQARYAAVLSTTPEMPDDVRSRLSRFTAPAAVRVSASRPATGNELTLHLVNYNRDEPPKRNGQPDPGGGIEGEKPIAVERVGVRLVLPEGLEVSQVEVMMPEQPDPQQVPFAVMNGELTFEVPRFLVYAVTRIHYSGSLDFRKQP
ncbi:MAG: hypothetical protein ABI614_05270 [Planctomycetota bacterium]